MRKGSHHSERTRQLLSQTTLRAYSKSKLISPFKFMSPEKRRENSSFKTGYIPWNKGLTKENASVAKGVEAAAQANRGRPSWNKGKPFRHVGSFQPGHPDISHNKGRVRTDEQKKLTAKLVKVMWKDPNYVLKQLKARHVHPNKLELILQTIIGPEFKYNGDGRLGIVLAGLVPDFVNIDGRKQVIELFGDYWHNMDGIKWHQTELGRIATYKSVGWDCLIIWEHELKDIETVKAKIKQFK